MAVSNTTKALKDIMRIDAGINGDAQYIEQITWMLFLKAFDYKRTGVGNQRGGLLPNYSPRIPLEYWADDAEGITEINFGVYRSYVLSLARTLIPAKTTQEKKMAYPFRDGRR